MNDLEMIREIDDTELPDGAALEGARADLLAALRADPRRHRRARALWIGASTTGVAAATALIVVAGTASHQTGRPAVPASPVTFPAASAVPIPAPPVVTAAPTAASAQAPSAARPSAARPS